MPVIHQLQVVFLLLLLFIAIFGALAQKLKLPYPILLVIGGLLISLIPNLPNVALSPNYVFLIILPPLLYSAAFETWSSRRRQLLPGRLLLKNRAAASPLMPPPTTKQSKVSPVSVTSGGLPSYLWSRMA
jgi:hypothetical protein